MVVTPVGYGTGTLYHWQGYDIVLTSAHVIFHDGVLLDALVGSAGGDPVMTRVAYIDIQNDLAVLVPAHAVPGVRAAKFKPAKNKVGDRIHYVGHPNWNGKLLLHGEISGRANRFNIIHSFVWQGSSGSSVFNDRDQVVGVIMGMDMDSDTKLPIEDLMYVVDISLLDLPAVYDAVSNGSLILAAK